MHHEKWLIHQDGGGYRGEDVKDAGIDVTHTLIHSDLGTRWIRCTGVEDVCEEVRLVARSQQ